MVWCCWFTNQKSSIQWACLALHISPFIIAKVATFAFMLVTQYMDVVVYYVVHCKYLYCTQYSLWQCYVSHCNLAVHITADGPAQALAVLILKYSHKRCLSGNFTVVRTKLDHTSYCQWQQLVQLSAPILTDRNLVYSTTFSGKICKST